MAKNWDKPTHVPSCCTACGEDRAGLRDRTAPHWGKQERPLLKIESDGKMWCWACRTNPNVREGRGLQ